MIDMLFVALFQGAAGDPTTPPTDQPTATTTATTPDSTSTQTPQQTTQPTTQPVRRCTRVHETGSMITRTRCTTAAQDDQNNEDARQALDRARQQSVSIPN